jgi:hypothetical protein
MIVFAESNFVLELAFEQAELDAVSAIVSLAEQKAIQLVCPAFALTEPYEALGRRTKDRRHTLGLFRAEMQQLARSQTYSALEKMSSEVTDALAASGAVQAENLDRIIKRLLICSTIIPLTGNVIVSAYDVRDEYGLVMQDALIFASVHSYLRDAQSGPKIFVNSNRHDFFKANVQSELGRFECELLPKFGAALNYMRSKSLGRPESAS